MEPDLLVMDEPTGNLDEQLTDEVITNVIDICKENGTSILIATHNKMVADRMNSVYHLSRGHIGRER
jgi:ABC-type lipoprotein export system ATPase subunit